MRNLTGAGEPVSMLLRADAPDVRSADHGLVVLINTGRTAELAPPLDPLPPAAGASFSDARPIEDSERDALLGPGEVKVLVVAGTAPVADRARRNGRTLAEALKAPRIAIERIAPSVDDGAFPIKRVVGRPITVEADIVTDGHDILAGELLWKATDEKDWTRVPLVPLGNDRWQATFAPKRIGRHLYTIEAWRDDYASLVHEISVKHKAGVDIALELTEARQYLEAVNAKAVPCNTTALGRALQTLHGTDTEASVQALSAPATVKAVAASAERAFRVQHPPLPLEVERPQAEFASWYELFPRSQSGDVNRHGTFDDVIGRLADIREMGFDVLYFPPIHPIGEKNRKGRNNSLTPAPGDPGSPYAIGSHEGGHDAIHPQLGTLDDFRRLVAAAQENGLEIALDFAIQCSPDHPWLREHPDWFELAARRHDQIRREPAEEIPGHRQRRFLRRRSLRPLDRAARRRAVLGRAGRAHLPRRQSAHQAAAVLAMDDRRRARAPSGRDLPVGSLHPAEDDVPARQDRLLAVLHLLHLAQQQAGIRRLSDRADHDRGEGILPAALLRQHAGHQSGLPADLRPARLSDPRGAGRNAVRPVGRVFGLRAVRGRARCRAARNISTSEKYEIRVRDHDAPGNIVAEIAALNRIRKAHPALQTHLGVTFYNAFNDQSCSTASARRTAPT